MADQSKSAHRPGGVHYLVVVEGAQPESRQRVGETPFVIGRKAPADWLLPDPHISRRHCRVSLVDDEVVVADLHSTNGTYIDGRVVFDTTPFPVGSKLEIGSHILEHVWQAEPQKS
jgi:pSer/pThr/pTyr-binding forkhead associated (FHA) protein